MAKNRITFIVRTYAYIQRYRQIFFVLLKYGFDDLMATLKVDQYLEVGWNFLRRRKKREVASLSRAERIRLSIEELGPTFVKMGQMLSTRSDLLPADILRELAKLQDQARSFPTAEAKKIIERELGKPCEALFAELDEEPLAAASIGQVYRARLATGELVAVKVQRPEIRDKVEVDLEIMHHLASLMESQLELGQVQHPTAIVDEFARTIQAEMDYRVEAANLEHFQRIFEDNEHILVHDYFRELSTDKVFVTEFVEGVKPTDPQSLWAAGLDPRLMASVGAELVMAQVFQYGFFHADPHPGNLLALKDGRVCFLDFGMVGRLTRHSREEFAELLWHVVQRDCVSAAETLLKLTQSHALVNRGALEREIDELIDLNLRHSLKELELGKLIRQLLDLTVRHGLRIPAHYFLLIKAVTQIESVGRKLDPEFDITQTAGPYVERILKDRYSLSRIWEALRDSGSDLLYLVREMPGEVRGLLRQIKQGRMKVEFEHTGLGPFLQTLGRVSGQMSSAIVLGSLIVGSSLLVLAKVKPMWHDISLLGLTGYLFSAIMGVGLLRSVWRSNR